MTTVVVESCRGYGKLSVSTLVNKTVGPVIFGS